MSTPRGSVLSSLYVFFSSRRRHTRYWRDWSSDVCSSDLGDVAFRGNFATIDEDYTVIDRRAGRIRRGTKELAEAINGLVLSDGTKVLVKEIGRASCRERV